MFFRTKGGLRASTPALLNSRVYKKVKRFVIFGVYFIISNFIILRYDYYFKVEIRV